MKAASQPATEGRGHQRTLLIAGWSFLHRITVRKGAVVHIPGQRCRHHDSEGALFDIFVDDYNNGCGLKHSLQYGSAIGSAYDAPGHAAGQISADGFRKSANFLVLPDFIGCEREGGRRLTKLKCSCSGMTVILGTVPPYNFSGSQELAWRQVNEAIRSHAIEGVDRVFDIAEELSQAAPRDNLLTLNICPMSTMPTQMEKRVQPLPPLSCPGTEAQSENMKFWGSYPIKGVILG